MSPCQVAVDNDLRRARALSPNNHAPATGPKTWMLTAPISIVKRNMDQNVGVPKSVITHPSATL
jgi:hypothetical protein